MSRSSNGVEANQKAAIKNRRSFASAEALAINLVSERGAGKTTLLEATIRGLHGRYRVGVIHCASHTDLDVKRIIDLGAPAHKITTAPGRRLDARMIAHALTEFPLVSVDLLFIENRRDLTPSQCCDLGENLLVVLCNQAESGERPSYFQATLQDADVVILNKVDLATPPGTDLILFEKNIREVNPSATVFLISCKTGAGLDNWLEWLRQAMIARAILQRQ